MLVGPGSQAASGKTPEHGPEFQSNPLCPPSPPHTHTYHRQVPGHSWKGQRQGKRGQCKNQTRGPRTGVAFCLSKALITHPKGWEHTLIPPALATWKSLEQELSRVKAWVTPQASLSSPVVPLHTQGYMLGTGEQGNPLFSRHVLACCPYHRKPSPCRSLSPQSSIARPWTLWGQGRLGGCTTEPLQFDLWGSEGPE